MSGPKLVGVIHLPPLVGSPGAHHHHPPETLQNAGAQAVHEARMLIQNKFDGIILENFGDVPFFKNQVPPETIACMSIIAAAVREEAQVPVGINILRNDCRAALAIAAVTGCDFIRVNVLTGVTATDQGIIEGDSAYLLRERNRLHAAVGLLADVHVKHGVSLSSDDLALAIEEAGLRSLADGVVITGKTTGRVKSLEEIQIASQVARHYKIPLYLGSGATHDNIEEIQKWVDGVIVGSALRKGGLAGETLDLNRVREFSKAFWKANAQNESRSAKQRSGRKGSQKTSKKSGKARRK